MTRRKLDDFKIGVMDFETDPFAKERVPAPFCGQFRAEGIRITKWGDDCVEQLMAAVMELPDKYVIYVHNGGRFDFHFMYDYIEEPVFIIRTRLIEFSVGVNNRGEPKHVFRDSLAIIPVALAQYQKDVVDYKIFERNRRELPRNKTRILIYLDSDCDNLLAVVTAFVERFGFKITVGQTAMAELRKFYPFEKATESMDEQFRPYYFGGRNQCFAAGILQGPWKVYDVNSQYPSAMRNFDHPINAQFAPWVDPILPDRAKYPFYLIEFEGENMNALPTRIDDKTEFTQREGRFKTTSHELRAAMDLGLVKIDKIVEIWIPHETTRFGQFVDFWYAEKVEAKIKGDKATELFSKFMLNSCYGKFGQNPREYADWCIVRDPFADQTMMRDGWALELELRPELELWSRPALVHSSSFNDVTVAASITSAARSIMLMGLFHASEPIYCDTDSVVCREFTGDVSDTKLGHWKFEGTAEFAAIAGRKTYCLYNMDGRKIVPVKWASKGGDLNPADIIRIAKGDEIEFASEVPTFKMGFSPTFMKRRFRKTTDENVGPFDYL
jgi:hypothetical protein